MPHPSAWQDVLDPSFVQRLLRPWLHPGCIDPGMASTIVARYQPMTSLPLVDQLTTRQQNRATTQPSFSQPIVYAQPAPAPAITPIARAQPTSGSTVIQAKFMASSGMASMPSASPSDLPDPVQNPIERSARSVADPPPLPLLQPPSPPSPDRSLPLRPRRPRFERDMGRQFTDPKTNLDAHLENPATSVWPASTAPATPPLPFAVTAIPNPSNLTETQTQTPVVVASQSVLPQQQPTDQRLLQLVRVVQPREKADLPPQSGLRPKGEVVRPLPATTVVPQQTTPLPTTPRVQTTLSSDRSALQPPAGTAQPLVFSAPAVRAARVVSADGTRSSSTNLSQIGMSEAAFMATEVGRSMGAFAAPPHPVPVVNAQPQTGQSPAVDVDALADKVERKLMRRLVVERERRGRSI